MFFSIVIPLYNKERYIKSTLDQVLNQSFQDFEIIVINDGSTDSSAKIVEQISDSRIKLFNKKNGGVSSARNHGIKKSSGKYIAFLDADDCWDKYYLEKMHQVITSTNAKIYCCCNAQITPEGKVINNPVKKILKSKISIIDYQETFLQIMDSPIHTSAVIISRDTIKNYQFDEKISMGEDWLFWIQIASDYKCIILNEVLSFYNREDSNAATAKLAPFDKTFIPTLSKWNQNENKYDKKLLTRIILTMIKPYYLLNNNPTVSSIIGSCDMSYATLPQRFFYTLPIPIAKRSYNIIKRIMNLLR